MSMNGLHWLAVPLLMAAGSSAQATQYATADEAAQRSFPEATAFKDASAELSSGEMQAVSQAAELPTRSVHWHILRAYDGEVPIGFIVFDSVVGKFELIDYAVAMDRDGKIRNVEILSYRESHGYEVRLPAWRKQFVGKGKEAKLRVSEDIANISGATLSSTHLTDGVRRIVAVVNTLRNSGKL